MRERATFGFMESPEDTGAPQERWLVDLDALATRQANDIADRIVTLSRQDRRGTVRTEEAAIQNLIIRGRYQGTIGDPKKFRVALIEAVQQRGEHQMSREIDRILAGSDGVLDVIRAQQEEYARAHAEQPTLRQFIGLNDALDASHAIDFVDIRYEPELPLRATEVALVQAKRGPITEEERVEIHATHRTYYAEHLATLPRVEVHERLASAVAEVEGEMERDESAALDLACALLAAGGGTRAIEVAAAGRGHTPAWVTCFLRSRLARRVCDRVSGIIAVDADERRVLQRVTSELVDTAHARELSPDALRQISPHWALDPRFLGASTFTSITDAGGARTARRLDRPGDAPKALTARTV